MTASTGASTSRAHSLPRGVMISCARRSVKSSERCISVAVPSSSVPSDAEWRTSEASSSGDRAEASSSWGSTPSRRSTAFAVPLKNRTIGPVATVNERWNPCTARAVASGLVIARFFGTSSPNTIVVPVASVSAMTSATPVTASADTPADLSGRQLRRQALQRRKHARRLLVTLLGSALDRRPVDGHERELRRHERAARGHERERQEDQQDLDHRTASEREAVPPGLRPTSSAGSGTTCESSGGMRLRLPVPAISQIKTRGLASPEHSVVVAATVWDGLDRQPGEESGREPGRDRHRGDQGQA